MNQTITPEEIRRILELRGWRELDMAHALGFEYANTVSRWVCGRNRPEASARKTLCEMRDALIAEGLWEES